MAESLAALGVASNIVQFVELGVKITKAVIETYRSNDLNGLAERNADLVATTSSLKDRCTLLQGDATAKADPITMGLLKRCIKVANELLSELERLKLSPANGHRSFAKLVISLKAYWKKSKIEDLAARITDIRKETFWRLEYLLHDHRRSLSQAMRSLGEASDAWNNAAERRLDSIAQDLGKLLRAGSMKTLSEDLGNFAKQLSRFADEAKHRGNIREILKSLHFAQIKERQNEIPQAHRDTFQWIYEDSSSAGFKSWLQRPNEGIFWVTGKPGSGKSTLMKLILGHQMTQTLANEWARPTPLVIVSHFFWIIGNKIQNSQEGLLRSLLFQIFIQCPEIIPEACSQRYSDPFRSLESWSIEELSQSFERIQKIQNLPFRFLLLVDGLDEYSGEPQEVIRFLHAVANSPNIKICCSSRPWPQFVNAFSHSSWNLEMQNLTKNDILRYAQDNLSQHSRFRKLREERLAETNHLVQTISDKSEGVFFWVSLVVKSLLRGLDNRDDVWVLYERLAALPSDLHQFFQRMLDSIEDVYLEYAFCAFTILLTAKTALPLYFFRHLSVSRWQRQLKKIQNPSIVVRSERAATSIVQWANRLDRYSERLEQRMEVLQMQIDKDGLATPNDGEWPMDYTNDSSGSSPQTIPADSWEETWKSEVREKVLARCRDLVQSWTTKKDEDRVGFLHRSVFEFLLQSPSLQRFLSQLECGPYYAFPSECCFQIKQSKKPRGAQKIDHDALLRLCHFMQELETDRTSNPASFWNMLRNARIDFLSRDQQPTDMFAERERLERLLGHAQVRGLLKFGLPSSNGEMNTRHVEIVLDLLSGSVRVDVGEDDPEVSWSDLIDLELLADILNFYEEKFINARAMMNVIWQTFLARNTHQSIEATPNNIFQACKIFVEHGATRYFLPIPSVVEIFPAMELQVAKGTFCDAIHMLRCNRILSNWELNQLEELFPFQPLPQI